MSAMPQLDTDRQQIERLTDVVPPPSFAASARAGALAVAAKAIPELVARVARLEADLLECREYLKTEVDVVDGDYGEQAPNRAMALVNMIDESLHGAGQ